MRYFIILFAALVLSACGTVPTTGIGSPATSPTQAAAPDRQTNSIAPVMQYLLTSAAADFQKHGPSGPLNFRDVRMGHIVQPDGEKRYLLCGQFQSTQQGSKAEWTPFATIKTTGYEQFIGGQGDEYCHRSSFMLDTENDLSSSLQSQLDSQR
jgi:hypothetical protein